MYVDESTIAKRHHWRRDCGIKAAMAHAIRITSTPGREAEGNEGKTINKLK